MERYMKRFKEAIRIIKVIDTKHAVERYIQRYSDSGFLKLQVDNLMKRVGKKIIKDYEDQTGNYGWHSKSTGAGGIIDWRRDTHNPKDINNHAIVVSLFPPKPMHTFNRVNARIIVERHMEHWAVTELGMSNKFQESKGEPRSIEYLDAEFPFYITFYEGKLYETVLDGYVLID